MVKKILLVIAIIVLIVFSACNGDDDTNPNYTEDEPTYSLSDFDGYWFIEESYRDTDAIQVFGLESENVTAIVYDIYGQHIDRYLTQLNEDELEIYQSEWQLTFDVESEYTLIDNNTGYAYYRGTEEQFLSAESPLASTSQSTLDPSTFNVEGQWNKAGLPTGDADTLLVFEGGTFKYNKFRFDEVTTEREGTYTLENTTMHFFMGPPLDYLAVSTTEEMGFRVSPDGLILIGGFFSSDFFLREDAIGTDEGNLALFKLNMTMQSWTDDEEQCHISFQENGVLLYSEANISQGIHWNEDTVAGEWFMDDDTITLTWTDGTVDECKITDGSFEIERLGLHFRN